MISLPARLSAPARLIAATLLVVVAASAATPVWAQSAPAPASPATASPATASNEATGRRHFEKGQELYNKNRFLEAAREFEAGYQALPRSAFLLNVGHSYRRAYELRKAKAAYELMLKVDPTSPHRPLVEDLIRTIDDALVAQETPPPAPASGGATSPGPSSLPLPSPAPTTGNPPLDLATPAITEPAPLPTQSRSLFRNPWFWGAVGTVLVTGTVTTIVLLNRSNNGCPAQDCFPAN